MPQPANDNCPRLALRPDEVSKLYGVSPSQLQKYRLRGDGPPYFKLSHRMVLYRPADVETWLGQFEVRSTSEGQR